MLCVCSVLQVSVELVSCNVRAHHVLRASLWLATVHRRWTFVGGEEYKKAGLLGVCSVLEVSVELVSCNVRAPCSTCFSVANPCLPKVDVCWGRSIIRLACSVFVACSRYALNWLSVTYARTMCYMLLCG